MLACARARRNVRTCVQTIRGAFMLKAVGNTEPLQLLECAALRWNIFVESLYCSVLNMKLDTRYLLHFQKRPAVNWKCRKSNPKQYKLESGIKITRPVSLINHVIQGWSHFFQKNKLNEAHVQSRKNWMHTCANPIGQFPTSCLQMFECQAHAQT